MYIVVHSYIIVNSFAVPSYAQLYCTLYKVVLYSVQYIVVEIIDGTKYF